MSEYEITPLLSDLLKAAEILGWERYGYQECRERDESRSWSVKAWKIKATGIWIIDESDMSPTLAREIIRVANLLKGDQ